MKQRWHAAPLHFARSLLFPHTFCFVFLAPSLLRACADDLSCSIDALVLAARSSPTDMIDLQSRELVGIVLACCRPRNKPLACESMEQLAEPRGPATAAH